MAEALYFWAIFFAVGVLLVVLAWLGSRRRRATPREIEMGGSEAGCGKCGYSVRGLPSNICPECGSDLDEVGRYSPQFKRWQKVPPVARALAWTAGVMVVGGLVTLIVFEVAGPRIDRVVVTTRATSAKHQHPGGWPVYVEVAAYVKRHLWVTSAPVGWHLTGDDWETQAYRISVSGVNSMPEVWIDRRATHFWEAGSMPLGGAAVLPAGEPDEVLGSRPSDRRRAIQSMFREAALNLDPTEEHQLVDAFSRQAEAVLDAPHLLEDAGALDLLGWWYDLPTTVSVKRESPGWFFPTLGGFWLAVYLVGLYHVTRRRAVRQRPGSPLAGKVQVPGFGEAGSGRDPVSRAAGGGDASVVDKPPPPAG